MELTREQRDALDGLAHSRTAAVRLLLDEYLSTPDQEADESCPECGRKPLLVVAGDALSVRAGNADALGYCRVDGAASWIYVHER